MIPSTDSFSLPPKTLRPDVGFVACIEAVVRRQDLHWRGTRDPVEVLRRVFHRRLGVAPGAYRERFMASETKAA